MRAVVVVVGLAGCYHPTAPAGAPCSDTEPCPSEQTCVAGACARSSDGDAAILDVAAVDSSVIDAPPLDACPPALTCQGNTLVGCGAPITCDEGCVPGSGDAHCGVIVPSNGVAFTDVAPGAPTLDLSGAYHLDTTSGTLVDGVGAVVGLPAGVTLNVVGTYRVLALGSFILEPGASVRVMGDRSLIVLATRDVTLGAGSVIDVGAGCADTSDPTCGGPGGGSGTKVYNGAATGCGPGQNGKENTLGTFEAGGGGGGAATPGGDGGGTAVGEGVPGIACGAANVVPLAGGSGGGAGGVSTTSAKITGGRGGGGGGAIQITAAHVLSSAGTITAGGGGGETGYPASTAVAGGGGGGGAGGGILLEGGTVTLASGSIVAANGGGGGGNTIGPSGWGESGHHDATCALGGPGMSPGNPGGDGACLATATPGNGSVATSGDRGGGGGSVGWIHVRAVTTAATGVASPAATTELATVQ